MATVTFCSDFGALQNSLTLFPLFPHIFPSQKHILIKLTKMKLFLKKAWEKQLIAHKGIPLRITADPSIETLQAKREWQNILRVMKEKCLQPRLQYPARIIQI